MLFLKIYLVCTLRFSEIVLLDFRILFYCLCCLFPAYSYSQKIIRENTDEKNTLLCNRTDIEISGDDLRRISSIDLWAAIKLVAPSIIDNDEIYNGSNPNILSSSIIIQGLNTSRQATYSLPLFILYNTRVDFQKIKDLDINDVDKIIIHKNGLFLTYQGIQGGNGIIEIITKKAEKGKLKVSYNLDLNLQIADISSYNLMSASEKLELEFQNNLYTSNPESYNKRKQWIESGANTNWLKEPLQTAFAHRHKLNLEGGDEHVQYKFSARFAPNSQGVMKGSNKSILGLSSYIGYRYQNLFINNTLSFDEIKGTASPYGSFDYFSFLNPYYTNSINEPTLGKGSFNEQINPMYEASLGSFDKTKLYDIYDNLNIKYEFDKKFSLDARFSYQRKIDQEDIYISPKSGIYNDAISIDNVGQYDILRNNKTTIEGALSFNYNQNFGFSNFGGSIGTSLFSGKYNTESFGGVGITSDRMGYISFTSQYNLNQTPIASQTYENTLSAYLSAYYSYDNRYAINASINYNKSSLLARNKRNAFFYSFDLRWNILSEKFMSDQSFFDRLALHATINTSGKVDFATRDYSITYANNIGNEYIYNYLLIGTSINQMPNSSLEWRKVLSRNIGLNAQIKAINIYLNYYNNQISNLLAYKEIPLATGFSKTLSNDGKANNSGIEYNISALVLNKPNLNISILSGGIYNYYKLQLPNEDKQSDRSFTGNLGWNMRYKQWSLNGMFKYTLNRDVYNYTLDKMIDHANIMYNIDKRRASEMKNSYESFIEKDAKEITLGSLQIGYDFDSSISQKIFVNDLSVYLTGNNLWYKSSVDMQYGIYYPMARSFTLSVRATF